MTADVAGVYRQMKFVFDLRQAVWVKKSGMAAVFFDQLEFLKFTAALTANTFRAER